MTKNTVTWAEYLATSWRQKATTLREWSAAPQAEALERCAAELEATMREQALDELSLEQAVEVSGYTYSSLQKKVATGQLDNVGEPGRPRVRRGDLPRKGGSLARGIAEEVLARRGG